MMLGGLREALREIVVSIVRIGLAETKHFSEGYDAIFAGTGAPQVGDAAAWAPRLAQGDAVLLDHTFNGFKSMPPMGACMDCTEPQYRALIEYMAGTALPKK